MNRSKAAISSRAPWLTSALAAESELRLLELLDFLELAVDRLPWLESVEVEPSDRELAWRRGEGGERQGEGGRDRVGGWAVRDRVRGENGGGGS